MLYTPRKTSYITAFKVSEDSPSGIDVHLCTLEYIGTCPHCNLSMQKHYLVNGLICCPDSYIIHEGASVVNVISAESFEEIYKPVGEEI